MPRLGLPEAGGYTPPSLLTCHEFPAHLYTFGYEGLDIASFIRATPRCHPQRRGRAANAVVTQARVLERRSTFADGAGIAYFHAPASRLPEGRAQVTPSAISHGRDTPPVSLSLGSRGLRSPNSRSWQSPPARVSRVLRGRLQLLPSNPASPAPPLVVGAPSVMHLMAGTMCSDSGPGQVGG